MSRPLKFRAWDKEEATMHYPTANSFLGLVFGSDGKVWTPRVGGVLNGDTPIFMETKLIPMQYTGLHDKAGKEIYEGDILGKRLYGYLKSDGTKDGRYRGKEWQCFPIEWGEYDASEAGLVSGYECETDGKYVGWNIIVGGYDSDLENFEVIGNIYEGVLSEYANSDIIEQYGVQNDGSPQKGNQQSQQGSQSKRSDQKENRAGEQKESRS